MAGTNWFEGLRTREDALPEDVRVVWKQFRNTWGSDSPSLGWQKATRELKAKLPKSSVQRKAINRVSQILSNRPTWGDESRLEQLFNDCLGIIEQAWGVKS